MTQTFRASAKGAAELTIEQMMLILFAFIIIAIIIIIVFAQNDRSQMMIEWWKIIR